MNMSEMGEVYAYLLRYRMAESRPIIVTVEQPVQV